MPSHRVFPDLDNHVDEYYARFGVRFAKAVRWPVTPNWRGAWLLIGWSVILAWQAFRLVWRGAR